MLGLVLGSGLAPLAGPGDTGRAAAQEWTLDVYGGHVAYDLASSTVGEASALLGVRYRDPSHRWLYLSTGIPLGSDDALWGATGAGTRLLGNAGPVEIGADLSAQGFLYRDATSSATGAGGILDLRPLAAVAGNRIRLELRSGWVGYGNAIDTVSVRRGLHDSDLTLRLSPVAEVRLTGTLRHVRGREGDFTFGGGQVAVQVGPVQVWGSLGGWASDLLPTAEWGAGASYGLDGAGRTVLAASVRQDATDPVYWNRPRTRWSVGISRALGDRGRAEALPRSRTSSIAPEVADGTVRIELPKTGSGGPPAIAGDFTDWEPVPMTDGGDHWVVTFQLEPGVYRYAFRTSSGDWYVPESEPSRRPDGFGGHVAVLVVS